MAELSDRQRDLEFKRNTALAKLLTFLVVAGVWIMWIAVDSDNVKIGVTLFAIGLVWGIWRNR